MARNIFRLSIENSFYFSFATFVVIWIASFLYGLLEKTPGRLSLGVLITILLSLIFIFFLLAVSNILLWDDASRQSNLARRLLAVLLFALVSAAVLAILGLVFWYPV